MTVEPAISDTYLDLVMEQIQKIVETGQPVMSVVHIVSDGAARVFGFIPESNEDGRQKLLALLRTFNADSFVFVSEIIASYPEEEGGTMKRTSAMLYSVERNMPAEMYIADIHGKFDGITPRKISQWHKVRDAIDYMGIIVEEW